MFNQVNTPVLGIVENMSAYICPHCGTRDELFGSGGGERLAREFGVPLLGQIPIVPAIRESGDAGTPFVIAQPEHPASRIYRSIAEQVLDRVPPSARRRRASSVESAARRSKPVTTGRRAP